MELSSLDSTTRSEEGVEYEIKNPKTGAAMGFFVTVKGADSEAYRAAYKEAAKKMTPETTNADLKESVLIATAIGWRGETAGKPSPVTIDGKEITFGEMALRAIFKRMPTVRDQLVAFQENRANFLPDASAS